MFFIMQNSKGFFVSVELKGVFAVQAWPVAAFTSCLVVGAVRDVPSRSKDAPTLAGSMGFDAGPRPACFGRLRAQIRKMFHHHHRSFGSPPNRPDGHAVVYDLTTSLYSHFQKIHPPQTLKINKKRTFSVFSLSAGKNPEVVKTSVALQCNTLGIHLPHFTFNENRCTAATNIHFSQKPL